MGGAGVALTYDEHALYKNPAGLAKAELSVKLPHLRTELSNSFLEKKQVFQDIADISNQSGDSTQKTNQLNAKIKELIPSELGVNMALSPLLSMTMPGFGVGLFSAASMTGSALDYVSPRIELQAYEDIAPMIGFAQAINIGDQSVQIGVSGYLLKRYVLYDINAKSETIILDSGKLSDKDNSLKTEMLESNALGLNLGALMPVVTPIGHGYFGVAMNNALSDITCPSRGLSSNLPFATTLGLGVETALPTGNEYLETASSFVGKFTLGLDYQLFSPYSSFFKRTHFGIEKKVLWDRVALRGGLNQGYFVGGIGLDLYIVRLDYVNYTEEYGSEIGLKPITYQGLEINILL